MSDVANHEIVWSEPPPSRFGASLNDDRGWFYDALRENPRQWAEWPFANGNSAKTVAVPEALRTEGFRIAHRRMPDGTRKAWVIYEPRRDR